MSQQTADQIGHSFLVKYYTSLAESPKDMIDMYNKNAYMAIPEADFTGGHEIASYLSSIAPGRKYRIHKVGAYESADNSVVVVAKGTMLTRDQTMVFSQTFVLVKLSENQYCIRNDILVDFQTQTPPVVEAVVEEEVEEVVEETVVEAEPEPEPEPVVEVEAVPEPTPVPTPAPAKVRSPAATPPVRPAEVAPVKEEPKETFTGSDWASRLRRTTPASEAPSAAKLVVGGLVARSTPVAPKRTNSPPRGGKGGRTDRKDQFSIYVSMGTKDFKEADIDKLFGKFGKILGKTLKNEKQFAFVDFAEKKAADAAINDKDLKFAGKEVRCQMRQEEKKGSPAGEKPTRTSAVRAPATRK